jgi:two-component system, NtrC family, sensor histidine kinase KinB
VKLRTKLLLAQVPLALSLVVVAVLAISTIGRLGSLSQIIFNENYRSVLAMQRIIEAVGRMDSAALFKLAGQWALGEPMAEKQRRILEAELKVEQSNITEPGEDLAARKL